MRKTGLSYAAVHAFAHGKLVMKYETARLISGATEGEVSIAELCEQETTTPSE
jgi:hypothetical protein